VDDYDGVAPEVVARWFGAAGPSPHAVASPVIVAGSLWGTIVAGSLDGPLPEETELRMAELTELLAIAIAGAVGYVLGRSRLTIKLPAIALRSASIEATTERGSAGDIDARSTHCRDTGAWVTQRHAISVETGWPVR